MRYRNTRNLTNIAVILIFYSTASILFNLRATEASSDRHM